MLCPYLNVFWLLHVTLLFKLEIESPAASALQRDAHAYFYAPWVISLASKKLPNAWSRLSLFRSRVFYCVEYSEVGIVIFFWITGTNVYVRSIRSLDQEDLYKMNLRRYRRMMCNNLFDHVFLTVVSMFTQHLTHHIFCRFFNDYFNM